MKFLVLTLFLVSGALAAQQFAPRENSIPLDLDLSPADLQNSPEVYVKGMKVPKVVRDQIEAICAERHLSAQACQNLVVQGCTEFLRTEVTETQQRQRRVEVPIDLEIKEHTHHIEEYQDTVHYDYKIRLNNSRTHSYERRQLPTTHLFGSVSVEEYQTQVEHCQARQPRVTCNDYRIQEPVKRYRAIPATCLQKISHLRPFAKRRQLRECADYGVVFPRNCFLGRQLNQYIIANPSSFSIQTSHTEEVYITGYYSLVIGEVMEAHFGGDPRAFAAANQAQAQLFFDDLYRAFEYR